MHGLQAWLHDTASLRLQLELPDWRRLVRGCMHAAGAPGQQGLVAGLWACCPNLLQGIYRMVAIQAAAPRDLSLPAGEPRMRECKRGYTPGRREQAPAAPKPSTASYPPAARPTLPQLTTNVPKGSASQDTSAESSFMHVCASLQESINPEDGVTDCIWGRFLCAVWHLLWVWRSLAGKLPHQPPLRAVRGGAAQPAPA